MINPSPNTFGKLEFRESLIEHFPEVKGDIEGFQNLVHLEMGVLESLANECIKSGNLKYLSRIYDFIATLSNHEKEVDSGIINAVHVSFLEGLNFENKKHGKTAKKAMPKVLTEMWEAQMKHNRDIGWLNEKT